MLQGHWHRPGLLTERMHFLNSLREWQVMSCRNDVLKSKTVNRLPQRITYYTIPNPARLLKTCIIIKAQLLKKEMKHHRKLLLLSCFSWSVVGTTCFDRFEPRVLLGFNSVTKNSSRINQVVVNF